MGSGRGGGDGDHSLYVGGGHRALNKCLPRLAGGSGECAQVPRQGGKGHR